MGFQLHKTQLLTRIHSNRMRTVRCSGQGGVCPGVCVSQHALGRGCLPQACWDTPPKDRILDTRLWKHYLSATTLRMVKILCVPVHCIHCFQSQIQILSFRTCFTQWSIVICTGAVTFIDPLNRLTNSSMAAWVHRRTLVVHFNEIRNAHMTNNGIPVAKHKRLVLLHYKWNH